MKNKFKKYNSWEITLESPVGRIGTDIILSKTTHFLDSSKDIFLYTAINLEDFGKIENKTLLKWIQRMLESMERYESKNKKTKSKKSTS